MSAPFRTFQDFIADRRGSVQNFAWGGAMLAVVAVTGAGFLDTATKQTPQAAFAMRATPVQGGLAGQPTDMSRRVAQLPRPEEPVLRRWFWQRDTTPVASIKQPIKNVLTDPSQGMPQH